MKEKKDEFESLKDYILEKEKEGRVVIYGYEGLMETNLDDLIKQPVEGILYDLNRSPEVILTFIKDQKWVNDYACMLVIKKLYSLLKNQKQSGV